MKNSAHNRLLNHAFLLTLIPVLALLGCPGSASQAGPAPDSTSQVNTTQAPANADTATQSNASQMTSSENAGNPADSTIKTKTGASFDIRLQAAIGQGYSWILLDSSWKNISQAQPQSFEPLPDSKPGSDGIQVFHFTASAPGSETIRLVYAQPFVKPYPKSAPRKTYHIEIQ